MYNSRIVSRLPGFAPSREIGTTMIRPPPGGVGPLRVVHVALQLNTGGMEKPLVEFARHADRDAVDLHFVSLGSRGMLADDLEACGWPVTALDEPPRLSPYIVLHL